jgi:hypothetical protein
MCVAVICPTTGKSGDRFDGIPRSRAAETQRNRVRQKADFAWPFKLIWPVQPSVRKYICLRKSEIVHFLPHPDPARATVL